MKLAVISDLHGNYYALSEVMAFLRSQEIDGIIGLGDFVTDGPLFNAVPIASVPHSAG